MLWRCSSSYSAAWRSNSASAMALTASAHVNHRILVGISPVPAGQAVENLHPYIVRLEQGPGDIVLRQEIEKQLPVTGLGRLENGIAEAAEEELIGAPVDEGPDAVEDQRPAEIVEIHHTAGKTVRLGEFDGAVGNILTRRLRGKEHRLDGEQGGGGERRQSRQMPRPVGAEYLDPIPLFAPPAFGRNLRELLRHVGTDDE